MNPDRNSLRLPDWLQDRISGALPRSPDDDSMLTRVADKLLARAAHSVEAERGLVTVRAQDTPWSTLADGLHVRELYRSSAAPESLRPGEPMAVELWHLAAGFETTLPAEAPGTLAEWLLVRGTFELDGRTHTAMRCVRDATGTAPRRMRSEQGAVLYRRVGPTPVGTAKDFADPRWEPMLEGVERLPLWRDARQEAYIIRARAGAWAPAHGHARDEECLMLDGELYFGDQLLRAGDFQLVPAGKHHEVITAATDALLYQRGEVLGAAGL